MGYRYGDCGVRGEEGAKLAQFKTMAFALSCTFYYPTEEERPRERRGRAKSNFGRPYHTVLSELEVINRKCMLVSDAPVALVIVIDNTVITICSNGISQVS